MHFSIFYFLSYEKVWIVKKNKETMKNYLQSFHSLSVFCFSQKIRNRFGDYCLHSGTFYDLVVLVVWIPCTLVDGFDGIQTQAQTPTPRQTGSPVEVPPELRNIWLTLWLKVS